MKQILLSVLVLSAFYFSSCENPMADATAAYNESMTKVDSLKGVLATVGSSMGGVQGTFQGLMEQVQGMESPDSTMMSSLQQAGAALAGQTSIVSGIEEKIAGFADFDLTSSTPEAIMEKVSGMQGEFGDIGSKLSGVQETIGTVSGVLDGIKEKIASMMSAATEG